MSLSPGARLGPYEIRSPLGAGGMGEVYRAHDTKLGRDVALKVLPDTFASDPDRLARFEREARVLASLNHPHIAHVYDAGQIDVTSDGRPAARVAYLAMELVDGEDLSARIQTGPLPLVECLAIAREIVSALDVAHTQGIVHRDLKPANIKLTEDGHVKVLDFGLAKALGPEGSSATSVESANSPTLTARATQMGMILGTAAYMAPEQARGKAVDKRADIFAFGCVLYEMATSKRLFEGDDLTETLASVIKDAPNLDSAPVELRRLLQRCLEKDPKKRLRDIGDVWDLLDTPQRAASAGPADSAAVIASWRRRAWSWMGVAAICLLALGGLAYRWYPRPAAPPAPVTFTIDPPEGHKLALFPGLLSLSPDGRSLAFVTQGPLGYSLWVRELGSPEPRKLADGDQVQHPFWSPDSKEVAYTQGANISARVLKKVGVGGGAPVQLAGNASQLGAWSPDGVIVYMAFDGRLYRVPDAGGAPSIALDLDPSREEFELNWPKFLPDGRRYLVRGLSRDPSKSELFLASLDSAARTPVVATASNADYAAGYLFYQRNGTLLAHDFDAGAGRVMGEAFPVVRDIRANDSNGRGAYSVSSSGTLAYVSTPGSGEVDGRTLTMFDRLGKQIRQIGVAGRYIAATLSPDGRQIAVTQSPRDNDSGTRLSLVDADRGVSTPFTTTANDERSPVWSNDGTWIYFTSTRGGVPGVYRRAAGGGAITDELLSAETGSLQPTSVSPDGRLLLVNRRFGSQRRIWVLPLTGERTLIEAFPGVTIEYSGGVFSPDGKWIAFSSGNEIYARPYPADNRLIRVSTSSGISPSWTSDSRHIVYRSGGALMSVELTEDRGTFRPAAPLTLFTSSRPNSSYSMDSRGQQFLLVLPPSSSAVAEAPAKITVILNWAQSVRRK